MRRIMRRTARRIMSATFVRAGETVSRQCLKHFAHAAESVSNCL